MLKLFELAGILVLKMSLTEFHGDFIFVCQIPPFCNFFRE